MVFKYFGSHCRFMTNQYTPPTVVFMLFYEAIVYIYLFIEFSIFIVNIAFVLGT